jgi:peptide-methionine (S)-S-oxide reductase
MRDHTEAIQIEFDPSVVTYETLLSIFWASHNPFSKAWSTQYKAVLWTHGSAQAAAAKLSVAALAKKKKRSPKTEVLPATKFWIAEDYHQKYYLRSRRTLLRALLGVTATGETIRQSTLAARANGWITGHGTPEAIATEVKALKLDEGARKALKAALGTRVPALCR